MAMELIRPNVEELHAYVPGEQPQGRGWIKLNTNENPYLAPRIAEAVAEAATDALRRYPDPLCVELRRKLSERYGVPPEQIICGNGSDELLTMLIRVAVGEGDRVAYPHPSYSLYETLAQIQNAFPVGVPLTRAQSAAADWGLPVAELAAVGAKLTLVTSPNAPTGTPFTLDEMRALAERVEGLLVFDEAYVDFGGQTALPLLADFEHVVVLRTMSKAFGLAGVRLGYAFGARPVVDGLYKIKDSYNVDGLTQVAGCAALDAWDEVQRENQALAARRDRVARTLRERFGWRVWPSAANFLLADTGGRAAREVHEALRLRRILVRYFGRPPVDNCLRISVGNDAEMAALVEALDGLLR